MRLLEGAFVVSLLTAIVALALGTARHARPYGDIVCIDWSPDSRFIVVGRGCGV